VLEAGPCTVVQKKTVEKDGYDALKVGFGAIHHNRVTKPMKGIFDKAGVEPKKYLRELRLESTEGFDVGAELKADLFSPGDKVDISGVSKGKGYQGAVKRHGHHRGPMAHGSKYHRGVGSMSSATTPGKVKKGKKMPGHMGSVAVTLQNLEVLRADPEKNLLLVKGAVPGARGAVLLVKDTVKR
jgi:large subunit ribosomal protein L3